MLMDMEWQFQSSIAHVSASPTMDCPHKKDNQGQFLYDAFEIKFKDNTHFFSPQNFLEARSLKMSSPFQLDSQHTQPPRTFGRNSA